MAFWGVDMTELNFKGKEFVYNHHLSVPFRPLEIHPEKGIGRPRLDGNLIIQGDNLHALKALLPMYAGKVDCIFIDPPYNTGNEGWAYNDNVNAPMIKEWLSSQAIGIEDGLRHDKWCAMMWPRLRLLHELLADTGSIWITLDDNENHRAKLMMDEIFGNNNFVANAIWQKKYSPQNDARYFSESHDHLLCYAKCIDLFDLKLLPRTDEANSRYKNPDKDPRGPWKPSDLTRQEYRERDYYEIVSPKTGKRFSPPVGNSWGRPKSVVERLIEEDRIYFGPDGNSVPSFKRFLSDVKQGITAQTIFYRTEVGDNERAKKQIKDIFQDVSAFSTPKPIELVERVIGLAAWPNAIILDSFAGSGTTAHAVLGANATDGGNRRYILIEMEDYADRLTAERVRRVIKGYSYNGTQKTELMRENLNWRVLENPNAIADRVRAIENLHGHEYDRIRKEVRDAELIVTGEKRVAERTEGLGGEFTYCTLGPAVELDRILTGDTLPEWEALGSVLFHMATNQAFDPSKADEEKAYLGKSSGQHVWLLYTPDLDRLKSPESALTLKKARSIAATAPQDTHFVFAPARYVSQRLLAEENIPVHFVPLPFALYRIERT